MTMARRERPPFRVPGVNLPLAKSRVFAAGTPRQVKVLNFGEESYGDLEEISEIIFAEMEEGSIAFLQIYEKQKGGDRSYLAYHIPRDIVDKWRLETKFQQLDAEGAKESFQARVATNGSREDWHTNYSSRAYLVGCLAADREIREIFRMAEWLESHSIYEKTTVSFNVDTDGSNEKRTKPTDPWNSPWSWSPAKII